MLESKELLPLKPTNKEEREEKMLLPKREDYRLIKEKLLKKEKLTVKNGLKHSETMLLNLPKKVFKKI